VEQANNLSILLRAGALPAPLTIVEERTVGPGLGKDSIEAGKLAAYVAGALVIAFMFVSYGLFGLFANIALIVHVVLILALMSLLGCHDDPARHRRHHLDHRDGGGFQCADL
jgi:preprotein translocase subunit SecD